MSEIRQIASTKVNRATFCGNNPLVRPATTLLVVALASGCTFTGSKRGKLNERLADESRALTTAVVDVLDSQPVAQRDGFTQTALTFAKQDQRVEGLPEQPFDVPALLAALDLTNSITPLPPENSPAVVAAPEEVRERFEKQDTLIGTRAQLERKLIERGIDAEEARNKRITRWTKFSLSATTVLGGLVVLFVFCPIALPIAGRLLAWLVGKIPSLASWLGVVSVNAFDAVVRGIEKTKENLPSSQAAPTVPVANARDHGDSRRGQENWIDRLQVQLSREMDAAHKALVRSRKIKLS